MKSKIIIATAAFLMFLGCCYLIIRQKEELDIVFVDNLFEEGKIMLKVCVKRADGKLVIIDIEKHKQENEYEYILNIYDYYRNHLPIGYETPLQGNFIIKKLTKTENKLDIELKILYQSGDLKEFFTALMWSYQYLGIDEVSLRIKNQLFTLRKDSVINREICSFSPYDNIYQIIYFMEGDDIVPVSFQHQENRIDFLLKKITSRYHGSSYEYAVEGDILTIRISDPEYGMTENVINMLLLSVETLNIYKHIIIIKNNIIVASS